MTLARESLASLGALAGLLPRLAKLPEETAMQRAVRALAAQDAAPAKPPEAALAKLRRDLVGLSREGRGFATVSNRDMRHAPWLLWDAREPLASLPGLLEDLVRRAAQRKSLLRALIEAWLAGYAAGAAMIREAGFALRRLVAAHAHPSMVAWAAIDGRLRLFEAPDGPRNTAEWLLRGSDPVPQMLAEIGFQDPLRAVSGYMRAVQGELLVLAADRLSRPGGLQVAERVLEFLSPSGRLRFAEPEETGRMVRALLRPWLPGGRDATEDVRIAVQEFLVAMLGDPRLRPQLWLAAGEEAIAVVRMWLTKASLDAFFRLISEHALDKHWRYREAFWGAYLDAGVVTDAWLAFAPTIYRDARTVKDLRGAFARLEGYGVQHNHAVLLMRVGDLVFCEWSHNGSLRAWPADWKTAPRLNRQHYSRHELMETCMPFPANARGRGGNADGGGLRHASSDTGHWQSSVAELIARRTGVRLTSRQYMPR